jgi:uncharacterized membrane protein YgaE (UPF0421/DUF939 family)
MELGDSGARERLRVRGDLLDSERRTELIEAAASWSRGTATSGLTRLRQALWPIAQTGLAAGIAWLIASHVLGHPRPFFAPVVAIIALGVMRGQRARRAFELVFGVTIGVGLADMLLHLTGRGVLTLMLGVVLAMGAAVLLNAGQLMLTESAVSAAIVATVAPAAGQGFPPVRLLDALVGGTVAIVFCQVLFPVDPVRLVRKAAEGVLSELSETLRGIAQALDDRDLEAAEHALLEARRTGDAWSRFDQALDVGRETARFAPRRRGARPRMTRYRGADLPLDLAVRDVHVLARGAVRALAIGDRVPTGLIEALRELADGFEDAATQIGHPDAGERVREVAVRATELATRATPSPRDISINVLAGYTQATAADLLRTLGYERDPAHEVVGDAANQSYN